MEIPIYDPFADARKTCLWHDYDERGQCRECGTGRADEARIANPLVQLEAMRYRPDAVPANSPCWGSLPSHTHNGRGRCVFCARPIRDPHNADPISDDAHPQDDEEERGALLPIF